MTAALAYVNILARDIDALSSFYARLFGFAEIADHRSPIYRCLDAGTVELGFNAGAAYDLLGLADRRPGDSRALATYITFEAGDAHSVDRIAAQAVACGGKLVKAPYDTYYNARQCVLEDPEGNVFRVNFRKGPRLPADQVDNPPWK